MTREWLLKPDDGAQETRLARTRRPDETHEAALADGKARSFEDRLSAIGDRQIVDAQLQPPTIEVSCSPAMLAPGLIRPPAIRLCSTRLAASRSMPTVSGQSESRCCAMIPPSSLRSSPVVISLGSAAAS